MADISKITLPSGNTYDIKDATAREMISGGVTFIIAWDGNSTPVVGDIPAGVVVTYNGTSYTGTLSADSATAGAFYLVKSSTQTSEGTLDVYDEYFPIGTTGSKSWEKIGDTQVDLSDVVTEVTLNKSTTNFVTGYSSPTTDSVIGADATFTVTDPTITVTVTPSQTYLGATASGGAVSASGDTVTVVTGYASPTTDTFVKSVTAETGKNLVTTSITPAGSATSVVNSVTDTTSKLVTTSITGVSGSTTASSVSTNAQTTADGTVTSSDSNSDIIYNVSVSNEVLTLNACTLDTQTTNSADTVSSVTVPVASSATTVATGSLSASGGGASVMTGTTTGTTSVATVGTATTVATGATSTSGTGDAVVTGVTVGSSATAITGLGNATTDTVLGTGSTFSVTNPTITLAANSSTATGRVQVATGISSATGSASGTDVDWNSKDSTSVLTGLGTASTAAGLNNSTTITVTKGA